MQEAYKSDVMSRVAVNVVDMGMIKKIYYVEEDTIKIELDDTYNTELIISSSQNGKGLLIDVQYGKSEIRTVKVRKSVFDYEK